MTDLQTEIQAEALVDGARMALREPTGTTGDEGIVERDELRDVDDRVPGKATVSAAKEEVSRGCFLSPIQGSGGDKPRPYVCRRGFDDRWRALKDPPIKDFAKPGTEAARAGLES